MFLYGPVWMPLMTCLDQSTTLGATGMKDTYTGLEVEEDRAGNVASVVGLSLLDCIP